MTPEMRRAVDGFCLVHGLTGTEKAIVVERLDKASSSPAERISLEAEADRGQGVAKGGVGKVLRLALAGLQAAVDGERDPWGVVDGDEEAEAAQQRTDVAERIRAADASGDKELARQLRETVSDFDSEQWKHATRAAQLEAKRVATEAAHAAATEKE